MSCAAGRKELDQTDMIQVQVENVAPNSVYPLSTWPALLDYVIYKWKRCHTLQLRGSL